MSVCCKKLSMINHKYNANPFPYCELSKNKVPRKKGIYFATKVYCNRDATKTKVGPAEY